MSMDNFEVLQKAITETKYLSQENSYRYRPIMRFFYHKYEQAENWLYKEDIFEELKDKITNYTLDDLERDLAFLVDNLSLTTVQDVKNASSIEEFNLKRLRYQMTDYAIVIERMTIELEELEVKVASLSPKRFEVLKSYLFQLKNMDTMTPEELTDLWERISNEFQNINLNYQDFLKKFQESKTEELLQSAVFLEYKNKMVQYLKEFIQGYLNQADMIKAFLKQLPDDFSVHFIAKLEQYQKDTPKIYPDFNYEKFNQVNLGRWKSIYKWFINPNGKCEGDRLLDVTSSIISQITKCASSLIELHGNMIQRKEEYKHICKLFDRMSKVSEARKLSNAVFGVSSVSHYKGFSNCKTDSLILSYEVPPTMIEVLPNDKKIRQEKRHSIIVDKSLEKKEALLEYEKKEQEKREILEKFVSEKIVNLKGDVYLKKEERQYLLNLISRARIDKEAKEPMFGLKYKLIFGDTKEECHIISEDGVFVLQNLQIVFEGES